MPTERVRLERKSTLYRLYNLLFIMKLTQLLKHSHTFVLEALRFDIHVPNIIKAIIAMIVTAMLHQKSPILGDPVNHCVA